MHPMEIHIGYGGRAVSALASQLEGRGFEPRTVQAFLCGVCMFLPVSGWVSSGLSGFPHQPITCTIGKSSSQVILTISLALHLEMGPRALHCGCPLLLTECPSGIEGWVKCRERISLRGSIKYTLTLTLTISV